jgi:hypothetical protein
MEKVASLEWKRRKNAKADRRAEKARAELKRVGS